ncbi:hypothetical protein Scep_023014 [Stephania cephalantha]|uniref:RING-type E3 ubiquitin transferase n=1 Tax=Stephania cephalantha TaxID=152367 RepID=A0AAP0I2P8_9MAGN
MAGDEETTEESMMERIGEMILTDPKVLDCNTCRRPLSTPVYQCLTGHPTCDRCRTRRKKCITCLLEIGSIRCFAIEKVMEYVKLSCKHAHYGCKETMFYNQREEHEKKCNYSPCSCPVEGCLFSTGSSEELGQHVKEHHPSFPMEFRFKVPFDVWLDENVSSHMLQERTEGLLFLITNLKESCGYKITLTCIGTMSLQGKFFSEIMYRSKSGSCLKLKTSMDRVKGLQGAISYSNSSTEFLLVPKNSTPFPDKVKLEVRIHRSMSKTEE